MAESNPSDGTSGLFPELPPDAKLQIKSGLRVIARMPVDHLAKLVESVKKAAGIKRPPFDKYAAIFNISMEEAVEVLSSAMLSATLISTNEISAEEFGQRAVDDQFIEAGDKAAISRFAQAMLEQDVPLRDRLERSRIATQLLPSFVSLDAIIDVRLRFKKGQVQTAVPVAVLRLSTDDSIEDEETIFQATPEGLEEIIEQLQNARGQLQAAEEWAQQQSPHKEEES